MIEDNFENEFDKIFAKSDAYEKIGISFRKKLPQELLKVLVTHRKLSKAIQEKYKDQYDIELNEAADEALNTLFFVMQRKIKPSDRRVEPLEIYGSKTREEAEKELQKKLENIHEDKDLYAKIFWDSYNEMKEKYYFEIDVFNKLKEVLVEHYYDDIIELEGDKLRMLNTYIYFAVSEFIDGIYDVEKKIKKERGEIATDK